MKILSKINDFIKKDYKSCVLSATMIISPFYFVVPCTAEAIYDQITGRSDVSIQILNSNPLHSNGEGRSIGNMFLSTFPNQGKQFRTLIWRFRKIGTLTGDLEFGVWRGASRIAFATLDANSTLTTSYQNIQMTLDVCVTLQTNDIVYVRYIGTTRESGNEVYINTTDIYPYNSGTLTGVTPRSITTDYTWVTVVSGDTNRSYGLDFDSTV